MGALEYVLLCSISQDRTPWYFATVAFLRAHVPFRVAERWQKGSRSRGARCRGQGGRVTRRQGYFTFPTPVLSWDVCHQSRTKGRAQMRGGTLRSGTVTGGTEEWKKRGIGTRQGRVHLRRWTQRTKRKRRISLFNDEYKKLVTGRLQYFWTTLPR